MSNAFLGANQGQYLLIRVQGHSKALLVPLSNGPAKLRQAFRLRIAMVWRVLACLLQAVQNMRRGWYIRVADGKCHHVYALSAFLGYLAADLHEKVRRELLYTPGKLHVICSLPCTKIS